MKATGSTSSKKRYSTKIRRTKELVRAYSQLLRGRGIFRRLFGGTKNLCNLVAKTDREIFPGLYYYPKDFTVNPEIGLVFGNKLFMTRSQTVGNYKELAAIYASTWIRRSEYIRKLNESIIWRLLEEDSRKSSPLERKIVDNLQQEASKSGRVDQETVVRTTIEREVSLLFNQAVRAVIAVSFDALKQDLLVRKKKRGNKYHLSIMALDIPKEFLKEYEKLHATKISKVSDSKTELRLDISELLPQFSSRKKTSHSLRAYLGSAFIDILRSLHFKSLNALGELVEKYIGEQAADQFYEKRRLLEQVILESFDQS